VASDARWRSRAASCASPNGGWAPRSPRAWFAYGSFFDGAVRQLLFAAVNNRKPRGLEITLDGAKYTRLIVSLDHPDETKTALTAR